jgi:peptidoglycan/LPS O-acetylase OafA/YrhL
MNKTRISELDALRGIAALSVVIFHFTHFTVGGPKIDYVFNLGWSGVDLFFIISGFVIFMTIDKCSDWKDFLISRFSRLYPAYWFIVSITSILILLYIKDYYTFSGGDPNSNSFFLYKYIVNMTMFQYYFKVKNIDGPYWTLTIELVFYIFMLLLFVTKSIKYIEKIGLMMLCLCFIYSQTFKFIDSNFILHKLRVAFPLINYFPLFFSGILVYKLKFVEVTVTRIILFTLCFMVQPFLFKNIFITFLNIYEYVFMLSVFYFTLILYLTNNLSFIVNKYTVSLGEISYSLYLIHQFVSCVIIIPFLLKCGFNIWISYLITLVIIIGIASLINKTIEKPAMKYIRNRYRNRIG